MGYCWYAPSYPGYHIHGHTSFEWLEGGAFLIMHSEIEEPGEYVLVTTTERDEKTALPRRPGAINGGFYQRTDDPLSQHPSIVIAVDDIKEAMKKVKGAGGKVLGGLVSGKPDDIPGVGLYVSFIDTEGNRAGMLQPAPMQSPKE